MKSKEIKKHSKIDIRIGLDEEHMPIDIEWSASDKKDGEEPSRAKAMLLSFFDGKTRETLKIDIWTREMQVIEMDRFVYQTFRSISDTYYKATGNTALANEMQRFVQYFGEKTEIIPGQK
jgi:gliding motility-associated protein GldC